MTVSHVSDSIRPGGRNGEKMHSVTNSFPTQSPSFTRVVRKSSDGDDSFSCDDVMHQWIGHSQKGRPLRCCDTQRNGQKKEISVKSQVVSQLRMNDTPELKGIQNTQHNTGGSTTRGDHRKSHVKTWCCGEGKGSQKKQQRAQTQEPQEPRRTWDGANGRLAREIAEARQGTPQEPRGTWYGATTRTHAQHCHVARETGDRARGRRENPIWQRERGRNPWKDSGGWVGTQVQRHLSQNGRTPRDRATRRRSFRKRVRGRCAVPQDDGSTQDGKTTN